MAANPQAFLDNAKAVADAFNAEAMALIETAQGIAGSSIIFTPANLYKPSIPDLQLTAADMMVPAFSSNYNPPTLGVARPVYAPVYAPDLTQLAISNQPTLDMTGLFTTAKPSWNLADFSSTTPTVRTDFTMPTVPDTTLPAAPVVTPLSLRVTPRPTVPFFDAQFSGVEPAAIDAVTAYSDRKSEALPTTTAFVNALAEGWIQQYAPSYPAAMEKLEAVLSSGLDGSILPNAIEQRIFDRGRNRVLAESEAATNQVKTEMSKTGHVMPPGSLFGALYNTAQGAADRVAVYSAETAIERTKLEIQHLQFCASASAQLRTALWSAAMNYMQIITTLNGQAIEDAKTFAGLMLSWYNAQLELYGKKLQYYQIQGQIYEIKLKSAFADLEAFKIEMEAEMAKKQVEKLNVEVYQANISAVETKIRMYAEQIQAIAIQASLEKMKVEVFAEQVRAYVGLVQAKATQFEAYRSAIQGDTARVQAYGVQVEAWKAEIDAKRNRTAMELDLAKTNIEYNRNLVMEYTADLERYRADIGAETAKLSANVDQYKAFLAGFQTRLEAKVKNLEFTLERSKLDVQTAIDAYKAEIGKFEATGRLMVESMSVNGNVAVGAAGVAAHVAGAALGSLNGISHIAEITNL
ncbi:MAG: hypothetical protein PHQ40_12840 [Anaerolineaceae bacterium]|nr:hypothetical protein [Anaerolineaceae bacterium]